MKKFFYYLFVYLMAIPYLVLIVWIAYLLLTENLTEI